MKSLFLFLLISSYSYSQEFASTAGVGSESISLPTQQTSINGLEVNVGESSVKGEFNFSFEVKAPAGINDLGPNLSLSYSSMGGQSEFGQGWSLPLDKIFVDTAKGAPTYTDSDSFRSNEGELLFIRDEGDKKLFAPHQNDMFSKYYYKEGSQSWTVLKKDGMVLEFLFSDTTNSEGNAFFWNISKKTDRNGNEIVYEYIESGKRKVISKVKYAYKNSINHFVVEFNYIDRLDVNESYRSNFKTNIDKVCENIKVKSTSGKIIRSYDFLYETNGKSLNLFLSSITENGVDGLNPLSAKPPIVFSYNHFQPDLQVKTKKINFEDNRIFPPSLKDIRTTVVDLNRDSFPDILETSRKGAKVWINQLGSSFKEAYENKSFISVLGTKYSKLIDVNGDRIVDFVNTGLNKNFYAGGESLSGDLFFSSSPTPITKLPPYPINVANVRTLDLNLDGRQDLIARDVDKFTTYISNESGDWTKVTDFNLNTNVFDLSSPYTFISDINGDGLPDISYVRPNAFVSILNKGNGEFSTPESYSFKESNPLILKQFFLSKNNFLIDVNSDGLGDLISAQENHIYVSLNQGDKFFGETISYADIHAFDYDTKGLNITTADMDADGNVDILYTNDFHDYRYFSFAKSDINLLSTIDNGLGKKTLIEYSVASYLSDLNLNVPFPIKVVTSIEEKGLSDKVLSHKKINYSSSYYNAETNEFRGFENLEVLSLGDVNSKDLLEKRQYELSFENINESHKQKIIASDKMYFDSTTGSYKTLERAEFTISNLVQFNSSFFRTPRFSYTSKVIKIEGDEYQSSPRSSKVEKEITLNSSGIIESIKDSIFKSDDSLVRFEEMILSNSEASGKYLIDRVCYKNTYNSSNELIYSEKSDYDGLDTCLIDEGNLTSSYKYNGQSYELKKSYTYEDFGGLKSVTDSLSNTTTINYGPYDLNIASVSDSASLSVSATYDIDTSSMLTYTDENLLTTSIVYDEYLRQIKKIGPNDSVTYPTEEYSYLFGDASSNSSMTVKKRIDSGLSPTFDAVTFFDSKGRDLCSIEKGEPGKNILTCKSYTSRGEVAKEYQPNYTSSFIYPSSLDQIGYFESFYDSLNRVTARYNPEHLLPVSSVKKTSYKVGKIESIDELGQLSSEYFDVLKRTYKRVDANSNDVIYEHNALDLMTKITATNLSETILGYDAQKRRICKNDPNLGLKLYNYNTEDLKIQTNDYGFNLGHSSCVPAINSSARTINYEYTDGRNRLTKIDYPVLSNTSDIILNYDSNLSTYSKAKVSSIDFGHGIKKLDYDIYGNETGRTLTIDGSSYLTLKEFNVLGQLKSVTYPTISSSSFKINYDYNLNNLLKTVKDSSQTYASINSYSPLKQIQEFAFGNNVKTTYTYNTQDKSYRLIDILTEKIATPNVTLQSLNYNYDAVSNIASRVDNFSSKTESYTYDSLHRLTQANISGQIKNFSFDSIGNIQTKNLKAYIYDTSRKQILSSVGTDTYNFDLYGNIQNDNKRVYVFDYNDRLSSVTKDMQTSNYYYDDEDMRVKKVTSSGTSYYIDKCTEITPDGVIRHIYAGEKLLASVDELGQLTYNHQDHLMSSNLRTDEQGSVVKRSEYLPFGETASESGTYDRIKFRYTSQYQDEESGLYYYKRRFYNPELGRFISADPLYAEEINERGTDSQELNLYAYVRNNPIKYVDPSGKNGLYASIGYLVGFDESIATFFGVNDGEAYSQSLDIGVYVDTDTGKISLYSSFGRGDDYIGGFVGGGTSGGYFHGESTSFFGTGEETSVNGGSGASLGFNKTQAGDLKGGGAGVDGSGIGFGLGGGTRETSTIPLLDFSQDTSNTDIPGVTSSMSSE